MATKYDLIGPASGTTSAQRSQQIPCNGATVTNNGPSIVYYGAGSDIRAPVTNSAGTQVIDAGHFDATLASGASATLDGNQWFTAGAGGRAELVIGLRLAVSSEPAINPTDPVHGGAIADGRDNSTTLQSAFNKAAQAIGGGGRVLLANGDWRADGLTVGDGATTVNLEIEGLGATTLQPYTPGGRLLTVTGVLGDDRLRMHGFKALQTANAAYDAPLISITKCRNLQLSFDADVSGYEGTLLYLANSYNGKIDTGIWRCGRYAVPLEVASVASDEQDNLTFGGGLTIVGSMPVIVRTSVNGLERMDWKFKRVCDESDRGFYAESTLAGDTVATANAITVQSGYGARFSIGDPLVIGGSNNDVEVAKVTGISSDTLNLSRRLRYAHTSGDMVLAHGACMHIDDLHRVDLDLHAEGLPVGVILNSGRSFHIRGLNSCGEFVRMYGGPQDLSIGKVSTSGSGTGAAGKPRRNILVNRAPGNPTGTPIRVRILHPPEVFSGSPTLIERYGDWTDVSFEHHRSFSGVLEHHDAQASSLSLGAKVYRSMRGLVRYFAQGNDGGHWWSAASITLAAPTLSSAVQSTAGTLADGSYDFVVTAKNDAGETLQSNTVTCAVSAGSGTASVNLTWVNPTGATLPGNVYMQPHSGGDWVFYPMAALGTTYTWAGGTGSSGPTWGAPPAVNTANYYDTKLSRSDVGLIQVGTYDATVTRTQYAQLGKNSSTGRASLQLGTDTTTVGMELLADRDLRTFTGNRLTGSGGVLTDVNVNTAGQTSAQIDAAVATAQGVAITARDGLMIYDSTNKLLLVRVAGKWQKYTGTEIA